MKVRLAQDMDAEIHRAGLGRHLICLRVSVNSENKVYTWGGGNTIRFVISSDCSSQSLENEF